ncbi:MAG: hypothetical protein VX589_16320, partial [Myxococcota bacterium]|nr:hypothetical protein [Myxococcota bacterium]
MLKRTRLLSTGLLLSLVVSSGFVTRAQAQNPGNATNRKTVKTTTKPARSSATRPSRKRQPKHVRKQKPAQRADRRHELRRFKQNLCHLTNRSCSGSSIMK